MTARTPQIVAFGGGGFSTEPANPLLDEFVLGLPAVDHPRVCFLPTASGDADHYVVRFYRTFAGRSTPSHVSLFRRDRGAGAVEGDLEAHLLAQDVVYVGGGSVKSLLGAWRAHGLDDTLRRCWERGVVLCGLSAGSLCWFSDAVTAFHGRPEVVRGLGLLPWSNCVHYDAEPERREAFRALIGGGLRAGYAVDDGAALHVRGRRLHEVVTSRPTARAYRVARRGGAAVERELPQRFLGAEPVPAASFPSPAVDVAAGADEEPAAPEGHRTGDPGGDDEEAGRSPVRRARDDRGATALGVPA